MGYWVFIPLAEKHRAHLGRRWWSDKTLFSSLLFPDICFPSARLSYVCDAVDSVHISESFPHTGCCV